jgi:hypothetical protein
METPHNKAIFDGIYVTRTKLASAIERCKEICMTEAVMGYHESAAEYTELARELADTKLWIEKHMNTLVELA